MIALGTSIGSNIDDGGHMSYLPYLDDGGHMSYLPYLTLAWFEYHCTLEKNHESNCRRQPRNISAICILISYNSVRDKGG